MRSEARTADPVLDRSQYETMGCSATCRTQRSRSRRRDAATRGSVDAQAIAPRGPPPTCVRTAWSPHTSSASSARTTSASCPVPAGAAAAHSATKPMRRRSSASRGRSTAVLRIRRTAYRLRSGRLICSFAEHRRKESPMQKLLLLVVPSLAAAALATGAFADPGTQSKLTAITGQGAGIVEVAPTAHDVVGPDTFDVQWRLVGDDGSVLESDCFTVRVK